MSKGTLNVTGIANLTTSSTDVLDGTVSAAIPRYTTSGGDTLDLSITGSIGQSVSLRANPNINGEWTPGYPSLGVEPTLQEIYQEVKNVEARIQQSIYELSDLKVMIQKVSDQTKVTKRDTPWG
tara:strand:- start:6317 stop:6688 length:372 start_codon:yes stop_codon:yes gene_type:complete